VARIDSFPASVIREIADVLGDTTRGLTNKEIDEVLATAGIEDSTPKSTSPYTYVAINKRDRLNNSLASRQRRDGSANAVIHFVQCAMEPVRYRENPDGFAERRDALNVVLAFVGLGITEAGKVARRSESATTLDQARARSRRLRQKLLDRGAHGRVIEACGAEIDDENYFHTVLEASKSVAAEIRAKTGLSADGVVLVDQAFDKGQNPYPILACNTLRTPTEWSEQRGVANMVRGLFGAFRNPTAHEPRVTWSINEQDALDVLSFISLLHRKLDVCTVTAKRPSGVT